jgi:3-hydroxyisobutyrate dehydrogenase-like beta-hydroxyacid dehydrogenase
MTFTILSLTRPCQIYPKLAAELDSLVSSIPLCHFVASPVFGAPAAADGAQLLVVLAGDYRSKKEVAYLFVPAIGRKVYDLGGNVEKACMFKLIGNSMILGALEIMGEAFTLGEKAGVEATSVQQLISDLLPAPP